MPLSFAKDIRPLFRSKDINAMKNFGGFDLSRYEDVKENCNAIFEKLENGSMPCDGAWPVSNINIFRNWIDEGGNP